MVLKLSEFLWIVGGAGITLLLGTALVYWIIRESLTADQGPEPSPSAPPATVDQDDGRDGSAESRG